MINKIYFLIIYNTSVDLSLNKKCLFFYFTSTHTRTCSVKPRQFRDEFGRHPICPPI